MISTSEFDSKVLLAKMDAFRKKETLSALPEISVSKAQHSGNKKAKLKLALLDLGVTQSLLRQLENLGLGIEILPYNTQAKEILRLKPDGLIVSNGPEEDLGLDEVAENLKPLLGRLPILGISCGMQILAKTLGARIVKMKLGHRGVNYPMARPATYKGEITVQNHGYVIDPETLSKIKEVKITGYNLNDHSIEEIESKKLKLIGTQYYPASPGFNEANPILKRFVKML
jgi:carbamoyl-phosphate synthase small subunit